MTPPEGFWAREASHAPLPWTVFTHEMFEARNRALRQMCTDRGLLFDAPASSRPLHAGLAPALAVRLPRQASEHFGLSGDL